MDHGQVVERLCDEGMVLAESCLQNGERALVERPGAAARTR
jgi:hypothetical protein